MAPEVGQSVSIASIENPPRSNRMMLLVFGTGAAIGLQSGLLHVFLWNSRLALVTFLGSALFFAGATYVLWRWIFPRLGGASLPAQIALQTAVSCVVFTILSFITTEVVVTLLGAPSMFGAATGAAKTIEVTPQMRQNAVRLYALLPIIPTVLITLIGYHQYWHRVLSLQHRERELTELAATAQLAALRAQINPHFLFNSLNSIAQLIRSDPDKAEACVERLADLFRYILRRAEKEFVPLADELEMTKAYLEIERARFGDRLRVETQVEPRSLHQLIPNLILQPLVENAVKHGLSRKLGAGTVRIDAAVRDGCLDLTVGDDGLGMAAPAVAHVYERGVGLRNLRDRLARLYGPAHLPEIRSAPGSGTQVRLRLPVLPGDAAA
ncbi:MAG TPA: histidine kinase [Candidatus Binatia bacterium]|nr:histidine kinase [Candidatus Binatia bacterium]